MPAKRHPSLIPLSHDHHHGLVLAFRLHEGLPRNRKPSDSPHEQSEDMVRFFHDNLVAHFQAEEEVLFPAICTRAPQAIALLDTLIAEHTTIRSRVEQLSRIASNDPSLPTLLKSFGDVLERHIRSEERELFPLYEAHIPEAEAARLGGEIARLTKK
jgi:iron-sulfur cluster repair protein YtfE (RIC family)